MRQVKDEIILALVLCFYVMLAFCQCHPDRIEFAFNTGKLRRERDLPAIFQKKRVDPLIDLLKIS